MKNSKQLRDMTQSVIMVILLWAVVSLTPLGQPIGIDNGKAALADTVELAPNQDFEEKETKTVGFGPNRDFFIRGEGNENVGSDEWFIDIDNNRTIDYVFNEKGNSNYKANLNDGNAEFNRVESLFRRGDGSDNVGSGEWFVDLNKNHALDYIYNEDGAKNYKGRLNNGDGNFGDNKKYFDRGSHNKGSGEWFVDLNGDDAPDYIYNESGNKKYHARLNNGDSTFGTRFLVFERGNGTDNVGSDEWFVDLNKDGAPDYIYNESGGPNYKGRLNKGGTAPLDRIRNTSIEGITM